MQLQIDLFAKKYLLFLLHNCIVLVGEPLARLIRSNQQHGGRDVHGLGLVISCAPQLSGATLIHFEFGWRP